MEKYNTLLYYCYSTIADAEQFAADHLKFCKELNLTGRIVVATEGLNGTVSGTTEACKTYMDTLHADLRCGPLFDPVCTNMGNPHATFFVDDAEEVDLVAYGPSLEHDALFPQRANIGVAAVRGRDSIRFRVWERGAGITRACGSGACAAMVAAHRRGLVGDRVTVTLDGGDLEIAWPGNGSVLMSGPTTLSFEGTFDAALLRG